MPDAPRPRVETRTLWYQVQYSRAAQDANDGLRKNRDRSAPAEARARDVALTTAITLLELGHWDPRRPAPRITSMFGRSSRERRRLARFLIETVEPSTLIMLAGLSERTGARHVEDRFALARYLAGGIPIHPRALIRFVRCYPNLSYRAAYNIACYYSGRIEDDDGYVGDAYERLSDALRNAPRDEQAGLAQWAGEDPSLAELRTQLGDDFRELVNYYLEPPVPHRHHHPKDRPTPPERRRSIDEE
jgi:hypothetical protein